MTEENDLIKFAGMLPGAEVQPSHTPMQES